MIDLHLHTTYSDGTRTPEELLLCVKDKFSAIAITDHDTIDGIKVGIEAKKKHGLDILLIPGIELSATYSDQEVHILGYGIEISNPLLLETLTKLKTERIERIKQTVLKLTEIGLPMDFNELPVSTIPGRAHVARTMVEKGYVKSVEQAFNDFLFPGKAGYVARNKLSPKTAIDLIHQAKGIAVLAHPSLLGIRLSGSLLKEIPVDGIEVYHSAHTCEETSFFEAFASKHKLLITGGSDCHGPKGKDRELLGTIDLPKHHFVKLLQFMDTIA